jgi:hypothetical protein
VLRRPLAACAAACLLGAVSLAQASPPADAQASPLRVLFVGNSLTAANDLPGEVARLARATGKRIATGTVAYDGYALGDHWYQGDARKALESGTWDAVVMQQGPSALLDSRMQLSIWAAKLAGEARAHGTEPALLTVWPENYRREAIVDVIASYRIAAKDARARLFPAGEAWHRAWQCNPRLGLYGKDGFHPSRMGTYLAALVAYGRLFRSPVDARALRFPAARPKVQRLLQATAMAALGRRVTAARRCG